MTDRTSQYIADKADAAFRQAAARVVRLARQTGTPVITWDPNAARFCHLA